MMLKGLLVALAVCAASANVVALRDSAGLLHLPTAGGGAGTSSGRSLSLAAAGEILSRALGLVGAGVPASELAAAPLPAGDILSRPEAAVLLMVPGVRSSSHLESVAPNLAALVKGGWSSPLEVPVGFGAASAAARLVRPATASKGSMLGSLPEQLPASSVVAASASPVLSRAMLGGREAATVRFGQEAAALGDARRGEAGAAVQVLALAENSAPETLRSELAAFGALPAYLRASSPADGDAASAAPDLVLLGVSALSAAAAGSEYAEVLGALDAALPALLAQFDAAYGGRLVVEIVLVSGAVNEDDHAILDVAQARMSRRLAVGAHDDPNEGFEDSAYLLKIWVAVVLAFTILSIIVCVPWSAELDPLLKSSIKSSDHRKRD